MKHTSKKQTQQSSDDEQQAGGIMDYWRMVANNRPFMLLLVGEVCTPSNAACTDSVRAYMSEVLIMIAGLVLRMTHSLDPAGCCVSP